MADSSIGSEPGAGLGARELRFSPFLPLLLLVAAAVAWPAFQCYQLVMEKQGLVMVHTNQARAYEEAAKLRASLDSLARDTATLADQGNPGAKLIVGELAKRGVTINPNAPPPTADKAAK